MIFLEVKKNKGIYYDDEFLPSKLNLSGAITLFAPTLEEMESLKQDLVENMQSVVTETKAQYPMPLTQDEFDQWFISEFGTKLDITDYKTFILIMHDFVTYAIQVRTEPHRRAIKRIVQKQQAMLQPKKRNSGVTEAQIEQAKEYDILDLIDGRTFKAHGKWIASTHCPLHGEKTPSFYVDKNNRFKCFGCNASGDSIAFVMQRDGVNFIQAVKSLL